MTDRLVARAAREQLHALAEVLQQGAWGQGPRAGGRELDRERKSIQLLADRGHGAHIAGAELEVRVGALGPRNEQPDGVGPLGTSIGSVAGAFTTASGGTRNSRSAERRSRSRLVTRTVSKGQPATSAPTRLAAPITCSKLSSTSSVGLTAGRPGYWTQGIACYVFREAQGAGYRRKHLLRRLYGFESNEKHLVCKRGCQYTGAEASRVLPTPPGPVNVTRRYTPERSHSPACAISFSRPTKLVRGTSMLVPTRRGWTRAE